MPSDNKGDGSGAGISIDSDTRSPF
jgi:hypothetical protein